MYEDNEQQTRLAGRHQILIMLLLLGAGTGMLLLPPVPQDQAYHAFADQRTVLGIPRFLDSITNLPFLAVGIAGLLYCHSGRCGQSWRSWTVFFAGVALVGIGSAWYHAGPNDGTLVWDRLPMTMAFTGISVAVLSERINKRIETEGLATAVFAGVMSILWWVVVGDLRPYLAVQLIPLVVIPLVLLMRPGQKHDDRHIQLALLLYVLAKVFESYDYKSFKATGHLISGHSLKHLAAAAGCLVIFFMLRRRGLPAAASSEGPELRKTVRIDRLTAPVVRATLDHHQKQALSGSQSSNTVAGRRK